MAIAEPRFSWLTRVGMAARGVLYIVIATVVLAYGRTEDPSGALALLARGRTALLLALMAVGFAGYGSWRLLDSLLDLERRSPHVNPRLERLGGIGSGAAHLFLAWQAASLILLGRGAGTAAHATVRRSAARALDWPGGAWLLVAAGIGVAIVGIVQFKKAVTAEFCDLLHHKVAQAPLARWAGRVGYGARGLVFLVSGALVAHAGWRERASEAGGVDAALAWLIHPWDWLVASGLLVFGLFCFVEARYRILREVPSDEMIEMVEEKVEGMLPSIGS